MSLVQVTLVRAEVLRLPRGERPVFELELESSHQTIVGIDNYWMTDVDRRETVDHHANFWVVNTL